MEGNSITIGGSGSVERSTTGSNQTCCTHMRKCEPGQGLHLKKCALIALHVIAEEGRDGEHGRHAPDLKDEWKVGCPKSPMWESEGEAWSENESVSSSGSREGNVGNDALHVIRLYGPGGKISAGYWPF